MSLDFRPYHLLITILQISQAFLPELEDQRVAALVTVPQGSLRRGKVRLVHKSNHEYVYIYAYIYIYANVHMMYVYMIYIYIHTHYFVIYSPVYGNKSR